MKVTTIKIVSTFKINGDRVLDFQKIYLTSASYNFIKIQIIFGSDMSVLHFQLNYMYDVNILRIK